jgi:hypothetical protein
VPLERAVLVVWPEVALLQLPGLGDRLSAISSGREPIADSRTLAYG